MPLDEQTYSLIREGIYVGGAAIVALGAIAGITISRYFAHKYAPDKIRAQNELEEGRKDRLKDKDYVGMLQKREEFARDAITKWEEDTNIDYYLPRLEKILDSIFGKLH